MKKRYMAWRKINAYKMNKCARDLSRAARPKKIILGAKKKFLGAQYGTRRVWMKKRFIHGIAAKAASLRTINAYKMNKCARDLSRAARPKKIILEA